MQLSHEGYRTRWVTLVGVWALAAFALFAQAAVIRDYLTMTGGLGLRGASVAPTPLKQMFPVFAADGQTWVRHALSLTEGNGPQLRHTMIDNAPEGREVHWNSAWAWTIATAGQVYHVVTGEPLPNAVEKATVWLNPLMLLAITIVLGSWVTARAGLIAGLIVIAALVCTDRMFEGFFPTYVDHHGLLTVAVFAMMLGAVLMGGGWWQPAASEGGRLLPDSPAAAQRAAIYSALFGAAGLWVSAASVIPPIALIGAAGLLTVLVQGRHAQAAGANFDPAVWRLWGRVGAVAALFFYLLEYFPKHLGMRLEPNHPLHAIAWLGGGELIAQVGSRWLGSRENRWKQPLGLLWPVCAIAVVPVVILIGGAKVFLVFDPFMANLHNRYIQEFLPLWVTLRNFTPQLIFQIVAIDNLPVLAGIATLTYRRREAPVVLWFATLAAVLFNLMGWWQSRWLLNASGVQICLAIVILAVWTTPWTARVRWIAALAWIGAFYVPTAVLRYVHAKGDLVEKHVSPKDAGGALFRDIAAALRQSQPQGEITLLASPNASTGIGYYGRFKTLGTLYWENERGLKAAAAILGARTEQEAAQLIAEHKVTHLAMVVEENFIAQYYELLHPGATEAEIKQCFGWRLLADKVVPQWLQMIPYKAPDDLAALKPAVMLLKVNFKQSLPDAIYNVALSQIALDGYDDAEKTLDILLTQYPQFSQPWLRKAEILLRRHNWSAAAEHFMKGINLSPPTDRAMLYTGVASAFYKEQQHGFAIEFYRRGLAETPNADLACYLAWVLATSTDDKLRKPEEALRLAQEALKTNGNSPTYLNTFAAALAENGRFPEAIAAADQALANSRVQGKLDALASSEQNLAVLRSGKPIRR